MKTFSLRVTIRLLIEKNFPGRVGGADVHQEDEQPKTHAATPPYIRLVKILALCLSKPFTIFADCLGSEKSLKLTFNDRFSTQVGRYFNHHLIS